MRTSVDIPNLFGKATTTIVRLVVAIVFVAPIVWMLITSLKTPAEIFTSPPTLVPAVPQWDNYYNAVIVSGFGSFVINTVLLSLVVVVGTLFSSVLTAYALSHIEWKGRNAAFLAVLSTLLLPDFVTIVPLFVLYKNLGLIGGYKSYLPLIIPFWFGRAFYIFLLRQFMLGIPRELTEAARIDGCSEIGILFRIIVPLCRPAIVTITLLTVIYTWSDFLMPLVFIRDEELYTVSIGLARFQTRYGTQWGEMMAATATAVIPIIVLFVFTQRYFIKGIATSGLK